MKTSTLYSVIRNQTLPHGTLTRNTGNEEHLQKQVSLCIQYHASKDGDDGQSKVLNRLHATISRHSNTSLSKVFIHRLTSLLILASKSTHYWCFQRLSVREQTDRFWFGTRRLRCPGWPGAHFIDQACLRLNKIHLTLAPECWD